MSFSAAAFLAETVGPYVSQLTVDAHFFGNQPISQKFITFQPDIDYLVDFPAWLAVQNGGSVGQSLQNDVIPRYIRNGRDLSAWTHVDVLYQGYFIAYLVLGGMGAPANPGNPYAGSSTQDGFGTFGGPDFAATIGEVATRALKAVWFQKWFIHRRARPEVPGAIAQLIKTGQEPIPMARSAMTCWTRRRWLPVGGNFPATCCRKPFLKARPRIRLIPPDMELWEAPVLRS